MKGKRHSPEQIIVKLREADALLSTGATLGQVCQKLAVSEATFHRRLNQYGGMTASSPRALRYRSGLGVAVLDCGFRNAD